MHQPRVLHVRIQAGAQAEIGLALDDRHSRLHRGQVGVGQADEPLEAQIEHRAALGRLPTHRPGQDAGAQVEPAPIAQHHAMIQSEPNAVDPQVNAPPARQVRQLGVVERHIVPQPVHKAGRILAVVTFLERPPHAHDAVADGEDGFLVAHSRRIEDRFGHCPGGIVQHGVEPRKGDAVQAVEAGMGMAHPLGRPEADRPHAGRQCRVNAYRGILHHGAVRRCHAQHLGRFQEDVGRGLAALEAVAIGHRVEQIGDTQAAEHGARVLADRPDADLDARGP